VFGCALLPLPLQCFGECASFHGYTPKARQMLLNIIGDEKLQSMAWPDALKACFTPIDDFSNYCVPLKGPNEEREKRGDKIGPAKTKKLVNHGFQPCFGSPMLDVALGQVQAIAPVQMALLGKVIHNRSGEDSDDEGNQLDSHLPPEKPADWVQCEACRQWRRLAWYVDVEALPDVWDCTMNYWEPADASCDVPQDSFDPESESTIEYGEGLQTAIVADNVGEYRDVFCNSNHVYYEAKLIKFKTLASGGHQGLFHFKGWSSCHDEWVDADSVRIKPHNLMTNPLAGKNVQEQEKWQTGKINKGAADKGKKGPKAARSKAGGGGGGANNKRKSPEAKQKKGGASAAACKKPKVTAATAKAE
jgi:hypothetical protein